MDLGQFPFLDDHERAGNLVSWIDIVHPFLRNVKAKSMLEGIADKGSPTRPLRTCPKVSGESPIFTEPTVTEALWEIVPNSLSISM